MKKSLNNQCNMSQESLQHHQGSCSLHPPSVCSLPPGRSKSSTQSCTNKLSVYSQFLSQSCLATRFSLCLCKVYISIVRQKPLRRVHIKKVFCVFIYNIYIHVQIGQGQHILISYPAFREDLKVIMSSVTSASIIACSDSHASLLCFGRSSLAAFIAQK